jgi:hypothetical protein
MPSVKTYYIIREPKICAVRDICIHVVFDSAVAAFQDIINTLPNFKDLEMWAIATNQKGFVTTEWLVYTYSRLSNRITKHADVGRTVREPTTPRLQAKDVSGASWEELEEFALSITY